MTENTATHRTFTASDAKAVVGISKGRWEDARLVQSDIPGVQYLSLTIPANPVDIRIEVYSDAREFGCATVIQGRVGHLIRPTQEMVDAFTARGGRSITD